MRSVTLICALLAGVLSQPAAATGQNATVSDSAGIRIVTSPASNIIYARAAEEPALTIGVVQGPEALLFERVVSVARDEVGNLVIADAGWFQIRTFNAGGELVWTAGGRGMGRATSWVWEVRGPGSEAVPLRWTVSCRGYRSTVHRVNWSVW